MKQAEAFAEGDPDAASITGQSLRVAGCRGAGAGSREPGMDPVLADIFVKEMRGHLERDSAVSGRRRRRAPRRTRSRSRSIARATRCSAALAWRGSSPAMTAGGAARRAAAPLFRLRIRGSTDAGVDALRTAAARDREDGRRAGGRPHLRARSGSLEGARAARVSSSSAAGAGGRTARRGGRAARGGAAARVVVEPPSALRSRDRRDLRRGSCGDSRQLRSRAAGGAAAAGSVCRRHAAAVPAHAEGRCAHGRRPADGRLEPRARDVAVSALRKAAARRRRPRSISCSAGSTSCSRCATPSTSGRAIVRRERARRAARRLRSAGRCGTGADACAAGEAPRSWHRRGRRHRRRGRARRGRSRRRSRRAGRRRGRA